MADYRITCANTLEAHRHITSVGISGNTYSVAQIYQFIDQGHTFYTSSNDHRANVDKYACKSCGQGTLRSHADGVWNNNLDNLGRCP